jgi:hypothetical protein
LSAHAGWHRGDGVAVDDGENEITNDRVGVDVVVAEGDRLTLPVGDAVTVAVLLDDDVTEVVAVSVAVALTVCVAVGVTDVVWVWVVVTVDVGDAVTDGVDVLVSVAEDDIEAE